MKNMRQRPRVEINHKVSCTCHDGNDQYAPPCDGMLVNISTSGALVETQSPLGGKFLVLGNKSKNNPRLVKGEVVYTNSITKEDSLFGEYSSGIKFTDLHENSKEFVVSIVTPNASTKPDNKTKQEENENSPHLKFDAKTINQILEEDSTTEELLHLDELFEEDNTSDTGYDVLETIAEVLEESSRQESEVTETLVPPKEPETEKKPDVDKPQQKPHFLMYFNAACFFSICFIITIVIALSSSAGTKIRLPFTRDREAHFPTDIKPFKLEEKTSVTLITNSIKSRFVKTGDSGLNFVISGLISNLSAYPTGDIKIKGRLFNKNNRLLGESDGMAKNNSATIPFLVTFSNPPPDISTFSIDVGL